MLTKDLINNIAETTGLTKKRVEELLNATNAAVRDALLEGKAVSLQGLGTLEIKQKEERTFVHPRTGEKSVVPAKNQLCFKPTTNIKDELKNL